MTQQQINIGVNPNDKTGDDLRSGGNKINANFTELYNRMAAAEATIASLGGLSSGLSASLATETAQRQAADAQFATDLAAETAARILAINNEAATRVAAVNAEAAARTGADTQVNADIAAETAARILAINNEAAARVSAITTEATARSGADTQFTADLAAEVAARQLADQQLFEDTTDNMAFVVSKSYNLQIGHTCTFPLMTNGQWVRISPANGDWYSISASLDWGAMTLQPASLSGFEPDAALLFIYHQATNQLRVRQ